MNRPDIIIIGGGISGLMSARELAISGARVVLLDRQAIGRESSWAGGGILSPLHPWRVAEPITALCGWSQGVYPGLADELLRSTGIDSEWIQSGLLVIDGDDLDGALRWAESHSVRFELLSAIELERIEPSLCPQKFDSLLLPEIAQVRNPRLLRALRKDLAQRGVELLEHQAVDEIVAENGKVDGVKIGQKILRASAYVLTAGAWSGVLAHKSGLSDLQVFPAKGEMLVFDSPPGLLGCMVLKQGRYLIPRKDGKILAGSTVENAEFNKSATDAAREVLMEFAFDILPPLREFRIEKHWGGLRPGSPDGIPTIGPHPEIHNLYFNFGHFRNGFVMAPASARLLADQVLNRPPIIPPQPYLPYRRH